MGLMKSVTKCHISDTQVLMFERFMTDHSAFRWHPYNFTLTKFSRPAPIYWRCWKL